MNINNNYFESFLANKSMEKDRYHIQILKNMNGLPIDMLTKPVNLSFVEQLEFLVNKGKAIHRITFSDSMKVLSVVSDFFDSDDKEFASHTLTWNPRIVEMMEEDVKFYRGDFIGDDLSWYSPMINTKISIPGYKELLESDSYHGCFTPWDSELMTIRVYDDLHSSDFIDIVNPDAIVLKEKL